MVVTNNRILQKIEVTHKITSIYLNGGVFAAFNNNRPSLFSGRPDFNFTAVALQRRYYAQSNKDNDEQEWRRRLRDAPEKVEESEDDDNEGEENEEEINTNNENPGTEALRRAYITDQQALAPTRTLVNSVLSNPADLKINNGFSEAAGVSQTAYGLGQALETTKKSIESSSCEVSHGDVGHVPPTTMSMWSNLTGLLTWLGWGDNATTIGASFVAGVITTISAHYAWRWFTSPSNSTTVVGPVTGGETTNGGGSLVATTCSDSAADALLGGRDTSLTGLITEESIANATLTEVFGLVGHVLATIFLNWWNSKK